MHAGECVSALVDKAGRTLREEGPGKLVLKVLRYPLKPLLVARAARSLRAEAAEHPGIEASIELVGRFN